MLHTYNISFHLSRTIIKKINKILKKKKSTDICNVIYKLVYSQWKHGYFKKCIVKYMMPAFLSLSVVNSEMFKYYYLSTIFLLFCVYTCQISFTVKNMKFQNDCYRILHKNLWNNWKNFKRIMYFLIKVFIYILYEIVLKSAGKE